MWWLKMSDKKGKSKPTSYEFASFVDGKWTNAPMLEDMLDNPEADLRQRIRTAKAVLREKNWTESDARRMYDIPDDVKL